MLLLHSLIVIKSSIGPWLGFKENNEYNILHLVLCPKTGRLLLFPAFLKHTVEQQNKDSERITISFNLSTK